MSEQTLFLILKKQSAYFAVKTLRTQFLSSIPKIAVYGQILYYYNWLCGEKIKKDLQFVVFTGLLEVCITIVDDFSL